MSSGPSLYRRHRPRTFADVVGQEHVVRTLSHAVQRDAIHHAYLFVGSRGTGKTSMAKILAACLNCERGPTVSPCGVCDSCVAIANATSLDVIEMDAASNNSVDDIRELREKVAYAPVSGRHKVYILDEAHMLSTQAWNAFLKTLEEPPPRTVFVLATTEAQKVLPTVVDRCHRFDFGRPSAEQVAEVIRRVALAESIEIDAGATALIARHATGSFRDALGTLEQLVTYAGDERIEAADVLAVLGVADAEQLSAAVDAIVAGDPAAALRAAATLAASGRDPGQVLRDLEVHGRELLSVQILGEVPAELRVTPDRDAKLLTQAGQLHETDAVRLLELVSSALEATANGAQPRIQLELALIKAAAPAMDPSISALQSRIQRLERGRPAPATPAAPAAAPPPAAATPTDPPQSAPAEPNATAAALDPPRATPDPVPTEPVAAEPVPQADSSSPTELPAPRRSDPEPAFVSGVLLVEDEVAGGSTGAEPADLTVEELVQVWPAVVEMVRGANAMLAVLLDGARPAALVGPELTLSWPAESDFYRRKAEQEEHRRATSEAIRNVTGQTLTLRYTLTDAAEAAETPEPEPEPVLSEAELMRTLVEEFGAQEIPEADQEEA